jgi:hypothetical protein
VVSSVVHVRLAERYRSASRGRVFSLIRSTLSLLARSQHKQDSSASWEAHFAVVPNDPDVRNGSKADAAALGGKRTLAECLEVHIRTEPNLDQIITRGGLRE